MRSGEAYAELADIGSTSVHMTELLIVFVGGLGFLCTSKYFLRSIVQSFCCFNNEIQLGYVIFLVKFTTFAPTNP